MCVPAVVGDDEGLNKNKKITSLADSIDSPSSGINRWVRKSHSHEVVGRIKAGVTLSRLYRTHLGTFSGPASRLLD